MSPRTEALNERIRDEQREKLLGAARRIFAHKGFAATKMADIATGAGVSYGLAYHYFTNKDAILATLVERAMQGSLGLYQQALTQSGTAWDRIAWLLSQIFAELSANAEYFMLVVQTVTSEAIPPELREQTLKRFANNTTILRQLIVEGQAAGQVVSGEPDQLTALCNTCIQGLAVSAFLDQELFLASLPAAEVLLRLLKKEGDLP